MMTTDLATLVEGSKDHLRLDRPTNPAPCVECGVAIPVGSQWQLVSPNPHGLIAPLCKDSFDTLKKEHNI